MTTIRTTCPRCGDVDMSPTAIVLSVADDGREGTYRFVCPACETGVEKRADRKIMALLVSAGVHLAAAHESYDQPEDPDPLGSPDGPPDVDLDVPLDADLFLPPEERRPDGPALTVDDLIGFHFQLEDEDDVVSRLLDDPPR